MKTSQLWRFWKISKSRRTFDIAFIFVSQFLQESNSNFFRIRSTLQISLISFMINQFTSQDKVRRDNFKQHSKASTHKEIFKDFLQTTISFKKKKRRTNSQRLSLKEILNRRMMINLRHKAWVSKLNRLEIKSSQHEDRTFLKKLFLNRIKLISHRTARTRLLLKIVHR
jgi:hypothetical protein